MWYKHWQKIFKKYERGRRVRKCGVQWALTVAEIDPDNNKTLSFDLQFLPYNRRDVETISPLVIQRMHPGGHIVTDCWRSYPKAARRADCTHSTVNHQEGFKDRETGAHTNNVEGQYYLYNFHSWMLLFLGCLTIFLL